MLEFQPCRADPDLWLRQSKRDNGEDYYEYVLLYADDCLVISENPDVMLGRLGKYFTLKNGSVGPPQLYLGAKVSKVVLPNGVTSWAWSSNKYVQEAVKSLEAQLDRRGVKLKRNVNAPIANGYRPELDISDECDVEDAHLYKSLIGTLRWMVELGRIDITCDLSMMSSFIAMPRVEHLEQLFHMFAYLKNHHNSRMVFGATYPNIDVEPVERSN